VLKKSWTPKTNLIPWSFQSTGPTTFSSPHIRGKGEEGGGGGGVWGGGGVGGGVSGLFYLMQMWWWESDLLNILPCFIILCLCVFNLLDRPGRTKDQFFIMVKVPSWILILVYFILLANLFPIF
jgi:hypothetical protein